MLLLQASTFSFFMAFKPRLQIFSGCSNSTLYTISKITVRRPNDGCGCMWVVSVTRNVPLSFPFQFTTNAVTGSCQYNNSPIFCFMMSYQNFYCLIMLDILKSYSKFLKIKYGLEIRKKHFFKKWNHLHTFNCNWYFKLSIYLFRKCNCRADKPFSRSKTKHYSKSKLSNEGMWESSVF